MKKNMTKWFVLCIFVCLFSIPFMLECASAAPNGGYKLVNFRTKASSLENTYYTEVATGKKGYTNGYYGADAIYLGMDGNNVKFKLSGVVGYVDKSEVELLSMDTQTNYDKYYTSFYKVVDGVIQHKINTNIYSGSSYSTIPLGPNTIGLATGKDYLSYDGHYFYTASLEGYKQMTDDYINGTYSHAVNAGRPYYNYYQYLSHRTKTNYTAKDIENYIKSLNYTSKVTSSSGAGYNESQLYGEQDTFINAQNAYGANALMMFGLAMNESNEGRSNIAIRTNNLFGHGAYDSAPGANATGYESVSAGILAHAKYFVSIDYMDPKDYLDRYNGGHFGNKASGFNVKYASDPYWGEKAAYQYYSFEKPNGFQDYGTYTLGIKTSNDVYTIRSLPDSSSAALYTTGSVNDYPVVILDEVTGSSINGNNKWYKIQADPVLNSDRSAFVQDVGEYDYDHNYAYIHSSAIDVIVKNGVSTVNKTYNITFNANGGLFSDQSSSKTVNVSSGVTPQIENPTREGYNFVGWSETVVAATSDKTYTAKWETKEYTITFDANGGIFQDGNTKREIKASYNTIPSVDEPTKEGYRFKGWTPTIDKVTKNTTYQAVWEQTIFYDITFNADGGVFSNDKEQLVVSTAKDSIPSVEEPIKDGYVFVGWTPDLTEATENTSYEAIWNKGSVEDYLTKQDGEFYLDYLKVVDGKLKMKGYHIIKGINNDLTTPIIYELILENQTTGKQYTQVLNRMLDEKQMTIPILSNGYTYKYSWFEDTINVDNIEPGDYTAYFRSRTDKYYATSYVQNILLNEQTTQYDTESKYVTITNNYMEDNIPVEFIIRNQSLGKKETSYDVNQYSLFDQITFENNKLHIVAASYSVGLDMRKTNSLMTRELIFENIETFDQKRFDVGSLSTPIYPISLVNADTFGKQKDRAWFDKILDLSDFEKGTYAIYLSTKSNISDYGELNDLLFSDLSKSIATINGKKYRFQLNEKKRNRIELIVE